MQQRSNQKKGFSLIEAAIVLAVVGGVIGGIWVSASNFYEDYKVNKTVSDLQLIVHNVQNLISIRDSEAIPNGNITSNLVQAEIIPKDWVRLTGGNFSMETPLGTFVSFYDPPEIYLYELSKSACIKIATKITSVSGSSRLFVNIAINGDMIFSTSNFPVSPEQAATACNQDPNIIKVRFALTRIN